MIISKTNLKDGGYKIKYKCYCGRIFEKENVNKLEGLGKHSISDQIQCPRCKMFIPTWN